jgi:hypothetical protein
VCIPTGPPEIKGGDMGTGPSMASVSAALSELCPPVRIMGRRFPEGVEVRAVLHTQVYICINTSDYSLYTIPMVLYIQIEHEQ